MKALPARVLRRAGTAIDRADYYDRAWRGAASKMGVAVDDLRDLIRYPTNTLT